MRELSMSELELVSGGYNTYDLGWTDPVTPPGDGGGDSGWGDWGWGDWGDYGGGDGGGGGGHSPDPRPDYNDCQDRKADTIARDLNAELATKPDSNRIEYGALIYKDENGVLQRTELTGSSGDRWTGMEGKFPEDFGMTSWSQVVGIFHHHPTEVLQNGEWIDITDPVYSASNYDKPSSGDWLTTFDFINTNGANLDNFTIYVSFNGIVKEFDAFNNASESRNPNDASGGHGTESGDYRPGTQCS